MVNENNDSLSEEEMIRQIKDIIYDRQSFICGDTDTDSPFIKDIKALKQILRKYNVYKNLAKKTTIKGRGE